MTHQVSFFETLLNKSQIESGEWQKQAKYVRLTMDHWRWIPHSFEKFQNAIFFKISKNSFYGLTWMGLKPHHSFFSNFFLTNMVARGVQSFCILEGATDPLIQQKLKFLYQSTPDISWTNAKNFQSISWAVSDLWSFTYKILASVHLRL